MTYELKTKVNDSSVMDYINSIENLNRKEDCLRLLDIMRNLSKKEPKMWGTSIVGFDKYSYVSKSGIKGEWFIIGFSSRKTALTIYIVPYVKEQESLLKKLGKIKNGKSCIYVKSLNDINLDVLETLIKCSLKASKDLK